MTQPPSHIAQVVKAAAYHGVPSTHAHTLEWRIAAAIRELVEQTLPEEPPVRGMAPGLDIARRQRQRIRAQQLAVAAELEGEGSADVAPLNIASGGAPSVPNGNPYPGDKITVVPPS